MKVFCFYLMMEIVVESSSITEIPSVLPFFHILFSYMYIDIDCQPVDLSTYRLVNLSTVSTCVGISYMLYLGLITKPNYSFKPTRRDYFYRMLDLIRISGISTIVCFIQKKRIHW